MEPNNRSANRADEYIECREGEIERERELVEAREAMDEAEAITVRERAEAEPKPERKRSRLGFFAAVGGAFKALFGRRESRRPQSA